MDLLQCPACGAPKAPGHVLCVYCSSPYSEEALRHAIPCPRCRQLSAGDQELCVACGAWIVVQCVFCGALSPWIAPACTACGEVFAGSQERKARGEVARGSTGFFPLFGIVLGRTPVNELERLGTHTRDKDSEGNLFKCYSVNGFDIWYDDGVADRMYLTSGDALPDSWRAAGFDWDLSYDDWNALLAKLRCVVSVSKPPKKVRHFSGKHDSFEAALEAAYKGADYAVVFKLEFEYGDGTTPRDKSTLYSIGVRSG